MMEELPPIYFYLPECEKLGENIPNKADSYTPGIYRDGVYAWTLQTYLRLKEDNFPCHLVGKMPSEGIVLVHRDSLAIDFKPGPNLLLVCLLADKEKYPYAQLHVLLNPTDRMLQKSNIWQSYYIPHWRQAGLIPRDPARGDRFENIAYFGHERNLAPQLKALSWYEQIEELGLHFEIVDRRRWNDFSKVDAILAVRSFVDRDFTSKPATKLYNSWHAGVPAILGCETSFQSERKSELDYIEVNSLNDILAALKRLRDDQIFRNAMVENGWRRAEETKPENLVKLWRSFITDVAFPAYQCWVNSSNWSRQSLFQRQLISLKISRMQARIEKLVSRISGDRNDR